MFKTNERNSPCFVSTKSTGSGGGGGREATAAARNRSASRALCLKEGNVLFNDALNTFYLRLYGVGHLVKEGSVLFNDALNTFYLRLYGVGQMLKEGNVLFNDALNTFYLWLYGVGHMVKDQSDSERGNPLPPHGLLFPINSKSSFICTIPDRIAHTTAFIIPVMEHWLEREIAQWVHPIKD